MNKLILFVTLLFSLTGLALADSNLTRLTDTAHAFTKGYNGSGLETSDGVNSIDDNLNTRFGYGNGGGDPPAGREITIVSEHTFSKPCTVNQVKYHMFADARANGKYDRAHNYEMYVQYYDGNWHDIPGSRSSDGGGEGEHAYDTGDITYTGVLNNVTRVRAYCHAYSFATGGEAGCNSEAWIYDLEARGVTDIGLRAYDGKSTVKIACEPAYGLNSSFKIKKNSSSYSAVLVDPSDARASKIRIKTNSGIKALARIN